MARQCITGKNSYESQQMAEDALIQLWGKNDYQHSGPVNVYRCEDCGQFHLTSRPPMNDRLAQYLSSHKSRIDKEANRWLDKLKHKH